MFRSKNKKEKSGIATLFTVFKLLLGNPIVRSILKLSINNAECCYEDYGVINAPIIYHAQAMYAGQKITCPFNVRFLSMIIDSLIDLGVKVMGGRNEDVKNAFSDPALRRGIALIMKGIALYGVTVPQKLPAPFMVVWNFTNICNLRCKHCYQQAGKPLPNELTLKEKLAIIEELDSVGVAAIALSGGEPTIHSDFLPVIKAASSKGMYVAVATNGWTFANVETLKKAINSGLRYIEVSIDSANPKKHDEFRGVSGSWERAVKALENAVKLGISAVMAVTLTRYNINEIDEILDLAESIGVKRVVFFNFIPVGRGREIIEQDLDPLQREEVLRKLVNEMEKRKKLEILSTAPQYGRVAVQCGGGKVFAPTHFVARSDPHITALAEFIGGCGAGRIYCTLQPNGDVTPCVFMPIVIGNIRRRSFWEIWTKTPLLLNLRDKNKLEGTCGKCPYRYVCGGCRARAFAYFGDPLAPDPGCVYNLKLWNELKILNNLRL